MSIIPAIRRAEVRFGVYRGTAFNDLTSYLASARVTLGDVSSVGTGNTGGDGIAASAQFTLRNDRPATEALHPGALASHYNQPDPLLSPYRTVLLEARMTPEGSTPGRWWPLFEGYLGDSIRVNQNAATIELAARDPAKLLMDTQLPGGTIYGMENGQRLDGVLNALLIGTLGSMAPTLRVVGIPDLFVDPYRPEKTTLWAAAQQLVTQAGWYLGWRRNTSGRFELTLMDPPREKATPGWDLTAEDIYTADVDRSDRDVRNAVIVWYTDPITRERTRWPEAAPLTDPSSIASLGGVTKLGIIELDSTSQIDSPSEAQALAERFLHDLSAPIEGVNVNMPLLPEVELFDMVRTTVPSIGSSQLFAVNSLQHQIEIGQEGQQSTFRTVIAGNSRVIGRKRSWLALEPRPGSPSDPEGPHQSRLLPPVLSVQPAEPGFAVLVEPGRASGVQVAGVEIHWSTVNGFTPSGTDVGVGTCKARGPESRFSFSEVNPETTYYVRARAYSDVGELGPFTGQFTVVAGRVTHILLDANTTVRGDFTVGGGNVKLTGDTVVDGSFQVTGDSIRLTGDTVVDGSFQVTGDSIRLTGDTVVDGSFEVIGMPRVITARGYRWPANIVYGAGAITIGQIGTLGGALTLVSAPFTVPAGKKWLVQIGIAHSRINSGDGLAAIAGQEAYVTVAAVPNYENTLAAGTYSSALNAWASVIYAALRADIGSFSGSLSITCVVLEVDA